MALLTIDCAYAEGATADAPDVEARADAIRIIVESVRRICVVTDVALYQYLENDDPAYRLGQPLRVTEQTAGEIDALWPSNVRLFVREQDPDLFIARSAVAIRPGCHRGTILLDHLRIELAYDACDPGALSWSLPDGVRLDPDEHAAILEAVARR
jgi:hypothetical protein